jgi:hypothetical protein
LINYFTRQRGATGGSQCYNATVGIAGWTLKYLKFNGAHQISNIYQAHWISQIWAIIAKITHCFGPTQNWKSP